MIWQRKSSIRERGTHESYRILPQETDLKLLGARLLTAAEYEACRKLIPISFDVSLWLKDAGERRGEAAYVYTNNTANLSGMNTDYSLGIRPAIEYDPEGAELKDGYRVEINGKMFTVVKQGVLLADEVIGWGPFRKDKFAPDCGDYEASDIKKTIDEWYSKEIVGEKR